MAGGPATHRDGCKCRACVGNRRRNVPKPNIVKPAVIDMTNPEGLSTAIVDDGSWLHKVLEWGRYRFIGKSTKEAAELIGITYGTMRNYISRARKEGYLKLAEVEDVIEHELVDAAVDVYRHHLSEEKSLAAAKDVMAGTGRWKNHQSVKAETTKNMNILAINIALPESPKDSIEEPGVVGKGHIIDVEPIKEEEN